MAGGAPVAFVHGADGGKMREVMKEQVDKEIEAVNRGGTRDSINFDDAIPNSEIGSDEEEQEEKRKKNMKSLKGSIMSKKVVSTF